MQVKLNGCPPEELPPYGLEMIRLKDVIIEDYQRELDDKWVAARSEDNMNPELLHPIMLIPVGRKYAVVEGQHRCAIAEESGREFIFAMILDARSKEQRSGLFLDTNVNRKRVTPVTRFNAGWRAKKPMYLAIKAALDASGIEVREYAKARMTTGAIATFERLYKRARQDRAEALQLTVSALVDAGFAEYEALKTDSIWAVGEVFARHNGVVSYEHMVHTLKDAGKGGLMDKARVYAQGKKHMGGSFSPELPMALVDLYNDRKPEEKLPKWTPQTGGRA